MADLAELVVGIKADTSAFEKGIAAAKESLTNFDKTLTSTADIASKLFGSSLGSHGFTFLGGSAAANEVKSLGHAIEQEGHFAEFAGQHNMRLLRHFEELAKGAVEGHVPLERMGLVAMLLGQHLGHLGNEAGSVTGAFGVLGKSLIASFLNPISLSIFAVAGLTEGLSLLLNNEGKVTRELKESGQVVASLKEMYGAATEEFIKFSTAPSDAINVEILKAQKNVRELRKTVVEEVEGAVASLEQFTKKVPTGLGVGLGAPNAPGYDPAQLGFGLAPSVGPETEIQPLPGGLKMEQVNQIKELTRELKKAAEDGTPALIKFREALAGLSTALPDNNKFQTMVSDLLSTTDQALEASKAFDASKAAAELFAQAQKNVDVNTTAAQRALMQFIPSLKGAHDAAVSLNVASLEYAKGLGTVTKELGHLSTERPVPAVDALKRSFQDAQRAIIGLDDKWEKTIKDFVDKGRNVNLDPMAAAVKKVDDDLKDINKHLDDMKVKAREAGAAGAAAMAQIDAEAAAAAASAAAQKLQLLTPGAGVTTTPGLNGLPSVTHPNSAPGAPTTVHDPTSLEVVKGLDGVERTVHRVVQDVGLAVDAQGNKIAGTVASGADRTSNAVASSANQIAAAVQQAVAAAAAESAATAKAVSASFTDKLDQLLGPGTPLEPQVLSRNSPTEIGQKNIENMQAEQSYLQTVLQYQNVSAEQQKQINLRIAQLQIEIAKTGMMISNTTKYGGGFGEFSGKDLGVNTGLGWLGMDRGLSANPSGGILSTGSFGFAKGGMFNVGGSGGTDSQHVEFMASPDEIVGIFTPKQAKRLGGMMAGMEHAGLPKFADGGWYGDHPSMGSRSEGGRGSFNFGATIVMPPGAYASSRHKMRQDMANLWNEFSRGRV